jgi:hypothetical protein
MIDSGSSACRKHFAVFILVVFSTCARAADVQLSTLFKEAAEAPVGGLIVLCANPGDTLVVKDGDVIELEGHDILICADRIRLDGNATIRSFNKPQNGVDGAAGAGGSGYSPPGAADSGATGTAGGKGDQGKTGHIGALGAKGPLIRFEILNWEGTGVLRLDASGQQGGQGQQGGMGGVGGAGQKGGQGKSGVGCDKSGGVGGTAGRGGTGGPGGEGGPGGGGGTIILQCAAVKAQADGRLVINVAGGLGGEGGLPGKPGDPGARGSGGDGDKLCGDGPRGALNQKGDFGSPGPKGKPGPKGALTVSACLK